MQRKKEKLSFGGGGGWDPTEGLLSSAFTIHCLGILKSLLFFCNHIFCDFKDSLLHGHLPMHALEDSRIHEI